MTKDEAMKLALVALEVATTPLAKDRQEVLRAQAALRQALEQQHQINQLEKFKDHVLANADALGVVLEQQPADKPYGWEFSGAIFHDKDEVFEWAKDPEMGSTPPLALYTRPQPAAQWVGLNASEYAAFYNQFAKYQEENADVSGWWAFAEAIEAKLREKNTGVKK